MTRARCRDSCLSKPRRNKRPECRIDGDRYRARENSYTPAPPPRTSTFLTLAGPARLRRSVAKDKKPAKGWANGAVRERAGGPRQRVEIGLDGASITQLEG